jgi:hypothetical protein
MIFMDELKERQLMDTLNNCSYECTKSGDSNYDYARGIFVGVVGCMMSINDTDLIHALKMIKPYLPKDFDDMVVPDSWTEAFETIENEENKITCPHHLSEDDEESDDVEPKWYRCTECVCAFWSSIPGLGCTMGRIKQEIGE